MRLRLGYLTPEFHGLQVYAEYEGNLSMQDDYNSLRNGKTNYEVVADPQEQELNQFWLSYKGIPDTLIKGGRSQTDYCSLHHTTTGYHVLIEVYRVYARRMSGLNLPHRHNQLTSNHSRRARAKSILAKL
jgi:hypothetical protein